MAPEANAEARPTEQRLTWAGLTPEEHAEKVAERARENAAKIPAANQEDVQRYRLKVVDDDVDAEVLYVYENSRFTDPADAIEHVRYAYPGEYAHGLYELDPVYFVGAFKDHELTVPFGEPLNGGRALWAVGYVRDYRDTSGHWCGEALTVTDYTDRVSAETMLAETRAKDTGGAGRRLRPSPSPWDFTPPPSSAGTYLFVKTGCAPRRRDWEPNRPSLAGCERAWSSGTPEAFRTRSFQSGLRSG